MKVSKEKIEGSQVVLNIEVEPEMVERSLERAYRRLANRANIPGFRRGKAPRFMVEHYLGKGALMEEALEHLVPEAYKKAIEENDVAAIAQPKIEVLQLEPTVSFKATVPVLPTVEMGDYRQLQFLLEPVEITEAHVDTALEQLRSRYAPWEPMDRPVQFGDLVTIDIESQLDGKPLLNEKEATYLVIQGLPFPLPGFPERLAGATKGETKEFPLSFPLDYEDRAVAGKEAEFKVIVKDIKEKKLPELNDEFAKEVGEGFETLEALRKKIADDLKADALREARRRLEDQVMDAVVGMVQVEYPDILVEHEIDHLIQDDASVPKDSRARMEEYLKSIGKTEEEFRAQWRPEATRRMLRSLVLGKVSELEAVAVSHEEVETEINNMALRAGEDGGNLRRLFSTPTGRRSVERMLVTRKTIDRLVDIALEPKGEGELDLPAEEPGAGVPEGDPASGGGSSPASGEPSQGV